MPSNDRFFPPHLYNVHSLPWEILGTLKSHSSQGTSFLYFLRINQVIFTFLSMIFFWSYEKLSTSVQNVVCLHARMLSVALFTCRWLHQ